MIPDEGVAGRAEGPGRAGAVTAVAVDELIEKSRREPKPLRQRPLREAVDDGAVIVDPDLKGMRFGPVLEAVPDDVACCVDVAERDLPIGIDRARGRFCVAFCGYVHASEFSRRRNGRQETTNGGCFSKISNYAISIKIHTEVGALNIYDIRRINLRILAGRYRTQKELADRCGWKAPYISQMLRGAANIVAESARKIEQAANMPSGWMDTLRDLLGDPRKDARKDVERDLLPISDAVADGRLDPGDLRMIRQFAEHLMQKNRSTETEEGFAKKERQE